MYKYFEDSNLEKSVQVRMKINPTGICYLFKIRYITGLKFSFARNTQL